MFVIGHAWREALWHRSASSMTAAISDNGIFVPMSHPKQAEYAAGYVMLRLSASHPRHA
jgi:hypothetical protein